MSDTRSAARGTFAGLALDALVRGDVDSAITYAAGWASLPDENGAPLPPVEGAKPPPRRQGYVYLSEEKLGAIAAVYRDALRQGVGPTQAVADHFGKPRSTASRWVMEARRAGFLGAAKPGTAGEVSGEDPA